MGDTRKNLKCSPDTFTRLSNLREETDLSVDAFLNELADAYEEVHGESEPDSDVSNEDLARELDILKDLIPRETANELESRLR